MSDLWPENRRRPGDVSPDARQALAPPPTTRSSTDHIQRVRRWATRTNEIFGGQPAAPAPPELDLAEAEPAGRRYLILIAALAVCAVVGLLAFSLSGGIGSQGDDADAIAAGPSVGSDAESGEQVNGGDQLEALAAGGDLAEGDTAQSQDERSRDVGGPARTPPDSPIPANADLTAATVQVLGLDDQDQPVCGGSGVVVEASGLILTNAHVVQADEVCDIASIGIAVTSDVSTPPELQYRASIVVVDDVLDLAVLNVDEALGADAPQVLPFVVAPLGDSDSVELGDEIRILGYPIIGGDTITSTSGTVSGFTSQVGIGNRAIMKTDAAISAGSSGGMALDVDGRVIGVPSRARASESAPPLDCRAIADTNSDGEINEDDVCVPVGGFLNGIRPVNLARPILAEARSIIVEMEASTGPVDTEPESRLTDVKITNPRFSAGQIDDEPIEVARSLVAGTTDICLFVDWMGMPDGVVWDAIWEVDGSPIPQLGHYQETWGHGDAGRNFWICAEDADGHNPGVYEIGLFLNGSLYFAESVVVAAEPLANHQVIWTNDSDRVVCELAINPMSRSGQVGLNELSLSEQLQAGDSITMTLPEGAYAVEARDCNGAVLADHPAGGVQIPDPNLSGPAAVSFVLAAKP